MAAAFRFSAAAQETVDGNLVRMTTSADFSAAQLINLTVDETIGNGAILACCTTPARTTAANHVFLYDFSVKEEGILIDPTRLFLGGEPGERYALTVTVITNTGVSYEAPLTVSIPAEENSEEPAESSAQPEETIPAVAPGEKNRIPLALDSSGCYHCRRSRSGFHGFDKAEKEIGALKKQKRSASVHGMRFAFSVVQGHEDSV